MTKPADYDLETAFTQLRQSLRNYLLKRVPDASLVDDLIQDIFLKALSTKRTGKKIDNLPGWLFAVARTTLVDHLRAKSISPDPLDENAPGEDNDDLQLHASISDCLKPFIAKLPPIYRDTLNATEIEGSTLKAYAQTQALSVSAVKSRVVRGRAKLKEKLLACCEITMTNGLVSDSQSYVENCCEQ